MDLLKKIFPFSFGINNLPEDKRVTSLVIKIIIYVVAGAIAGVIIGVTSQLPIIGIILGSLGAIVDIYMTAGIVLTILDFCKVLK